MSENNFEVDITGDIAEAFGSKEKLLEYDLICPCCTYGPDRAPENMKEQYILNVVEAVDEGVGLAGCHGGMCDAFRESVIWQFLTGASWVAHPGVKYYHGADEEYRPVGWNIIPYEVNVRTASSSELVRGIPNFKVNSEQYYLHVDPAVEVLATTTFPNPNAKDGPYKSMGQVVMPVVFTKVWGKGRIYYNSLGHTNDVFDIPEAAELMKRGLLWAAR